MGDVNFSRIDTAQLLHDAWAAVCDEDSETLGGAMLELCLRGLKGSPLSEADGLELLRLIGILDMPPDRSIADIRAADIRAITDLDLRLLFSEAFVADDIRDEMRRRNLEPLGEPH